MKYFEASAKKDIGIAAFFETLMTQVYKKRFNDEPRRETFTLNRNQATAQEAQAAPQKKKGCC